MSFFEILWKKHPLQGALSYLNWHQVLVAQWIAHQTSNLGVAGSNPVENVLFIILKTDLQLQHKARVCGFASIAQLAEHLPRKQKVTSSILVGGLTRAVGLEV